MNTSIAPSLGPGPLGLASWRLRLGITRTEAAALLEVPLSTYSAWERGEWRPRPHHLPRLGRITGVPPTAWLARSGR